MRQLFYAILFLCLGFGVAGQALSALQFVTKNKTAMKSDEEKTNETWKKMLTPKQYYILREKGTEAPYSGELLMQKDEGLYRCVACGNELFSSEAKFDSHCGWPSFDKEIKAGKITIAADTSLGMQRTEIMCANCGGHLGHLFTDGPTNTGMRYCVNSVSLTFEPKNNEMLDTLVLGAGCFWCVEAFFQRLKGVVSVSSGYAGGEVENPSYEQVCSGTTGHAEVIRIAYNPAIITMETLLEVFFEMHDPTTVNRQGNDVGTQYRSVIFYKNDEEKKVAEQIIAAYTLQQKFDRLIVTTLEPFVLFYKAEDYHQNYYNENGNQPYCKLIIMPKLRKFEKLFADDIN